MRQFEVGRGGLIAHFMVAKSPPEPNRLPAAAAESHGQAEPCTENPQLRKGTLR